MTRKATKSKVTAPGSKQNNGRRFSTPVISADSAVDGVAFSDLLSTERGASEDQVLDTLLARITDKLSDQGAEKAQMHEFLSLILDTDPALKEEILRGIRVSK